ncbi:MAG: PaaI family thioesterase [Betaproteobacteria bacterium]|jgi:uncharacterized protein (TIGR00369 family)|nr:PaaI family thioesterase [Polynucleobacter sp.]MCF8196101.1 PaaI family thioesterase [Polynucleobacter sp.]MCX7252767.1 PaaI family thioesterase [Burkholderiales bacterium]NBY64683.1 PaaI family thioesterase [Betaproteobacteria bacterium]NQW57293.1 PaaI family thioesterase [Polynucleobacter sp.]
MSQTYFGIEIPFIEKMAMDVEKISEDLVHVHLDLQPWQCNSFGVAHGGVMMTLLDFAMAMAAKVKHGHLGGAMTIDMSTSFIKGGKGKMVVHGTVLKAGKSIQFCEASAYDASGDLLAKSMGTFKLVEFR